ncbi:DUF2125 domain-containing protein [Defluviimonas sp. SAOS-178_SWC]|uniref:DUF2125 domain-containing protein n=1 Tax=Defluviimonas sp. SAOS-178_SWC TaxID=3121287 RepID=UPI003221A4A1
MKQWTGLGAGALSAFLLGSTALYADVTAEEVWQGMADYYADLGQSVTAGSKGMDGDTLVITDAVFATQTPEGSFSATIGEIRLKELGDGRVEVTMSNDIPVALLTKPETGETVDMGVKITQSGLSMIVSGSAGDTTYDFTAPEMSVVIDGMKVDGADVPLTLNATLTGNSGSYRMASEGGRAITSDMKVDKVDFNIAAQDPEGQGNFSASGSLTGLSGTSSASFPDGIDMADMNAALQAGLSMDGTFGYSGGGYVMDFADGTETVNAQSTGGGGTLHFEMSKDGLAYGGEGHDTKVSMQMSAFPLPIDVTLAQTAFDLTLPVSKDDAAQPFGLLVKLVDLEVSDGLWSMFDPTSQLPRDPATLILDVKGAAKMLVNIFDPKDAETIAAAPPGEVESLNIDEVKVSAVGAELTGTGAMTFDNSAGMPMPIGAVDLQLVGGNGLIDKLVAMGFVPEDQAMGARMMMGLFAVPTGEDTLTSKIEFKEGGSIFANGQQIQ